VVLLRGSRFLRASELATSPGGPSTTVSTRPGSSTTSGLWTAPEILWPTLGHAEGETPLNAFDNALVAAGIGQWNLVKVTSIAPPGAQVVDVPVGAAPGTLVPAVLASITSSRPGEQVTSCIGIGINREGHGMIMEHSGAGTPAEMEAIVRGMIDEALARRGLTPEETIVRSVSHTVERVGSCVAAVVLWWR
jgi:arginine decarboxylase